MSEIELISEKSENTDIFTSTCSSGDKKPQNIPEYQEWLYKNLREETSTSARNYFESVLSKVKADFENSDFWIKLTGNLQEYGQEYYINTDYYLFANNSPYDLKPKLLIKSYDSFLLKTFRHNVINNINWPNAPNEGWILPSKGFSLINDLVRTLVVVKYLDGVEFIIEKIKNIDCNCKVEFKAKEEGYYAAHVYIKRTYEIPKFDWNTRNEDILVEIQITTQLQEVIRKLLHKHYETNRKKIDIESTKWQWNYKSDEFSSNYMGHILHYIEGMIMDIRDKQKTKTVIESLRDDIYE